MAHHLKVNIEAKQPIAIKEYYNDEQTQRLEEMGGVPKNKALLGVEVPFYKRANAIIDRKPKAKPQVGPFPSVGYIVY